MKIPSKQQGSLFDEPKPNSPEDLGMAPVGPIRPDGVDTRAPADKRYGEETPGPDPVPHNVASGTIQIGDARKFVEWVHGLDIPIHADVTVGHVLVGLSGFQPSHLRWLCQAIRQAEQAPHIGQMREALRAKDVGILREVRD